VPALARIFAENEHAANRSKERIADHILLAAFRVRCYVWWQLVLTVRGEKARRFAASQLPHVTLRKFSATVAGVVAARS